MNPIIVIGSGSREHAIIKKLLPYNKEIFCIGTNKNPFIINNTIYCEYNDDNNLKMIIVELSKKTIFDFAIIGPEAPLEIGISDLLHLLEIPCIAPFQSYAFLETSKIFARNLINEIGLNEYNPKFYMGNTDFKDISLNEWVFKKDGLNGGKGVVVENIDFKKQQRLDIYNSIKKEIFLIEEKLYGEEFSLITATNGYKSMIHFPPVQDYKRLNDNDIGPNTGGMGALIDVNNSLSFLNEEDIKTAQFLNEYIIKELFNRHKNLNLEFGYRGFLYGSFIKTKHGIKLIEYNCRLGDPEGVLLLELFNGNFYNFCKEMVSNKPLSPVIFSKQSIIGVYMVPKNYPSNEFDKYDIYFDNKDSKILNNYYFGNCEISDDKKHIYSLKSRSILVVSKGDNLYSAKNNVYNLIQNITGNLQYRKDIGNKFLTKYEQSGVSIKQGDNVVNLIKPWVQMTQKNNVTSDYGSFGGEFNFKGHTLVSSIDGVGTKSILATEWFGYEAYIDLGYDIVNHSINDILVQNSIPLFFLDYYGCNTLKSAEILQFIKGVSLACQKYNITLIGGETAEMPSIYKNNITDLVGAIVGYKVCNISKPQSNDILLGIRSDSPHTNGYSLIRKVLNNVNVPFAMKEILCKPHKCYYQEVTEIIEEFSPYNIHGMAHITGGGLKGNISRITGNLEFTIEKDFPFGTPNWCDYLMDIGNISIEEMKSVFNCGVGFVIIVSPELYETIKIMDKFCYLKKIGFIN